MNENNTTRMRWLFVFLILGSLLPELSAQPAKENKDIFMPTRMRAIASVAGNSGGGVLTFSEVSRLEGHRFLFNEFLPGRVLFTGYEYLSEEIGMVIDGEFERLYIQFEDETEGQLPLAKIQAIEVYPGEGDTLEYVVQNLGKVTTDADNRLQFYQRLYGGEDFVILHHERKYLRREAYMENVGIVRRPDEYKSLHSYFVVHQGEVKKIKKSRRSAEKALPAYKKEIREIVRETDNSLRSNQDLIDLFVQLEERI